MSNTRMGEGVCLQDRYVCLALYRDVYVCVQGRCLKGSWGQERLGLNSNTRGDVSVCMKGRCII